MNAQAILEGRRPSVAFDEYMRVNPGSDKFRVAAAFADAFPNVDSVCHQVIWKWRRPGMDDEKLDLILSDLLRKAGYPLRAASISDHLGHETAKAQSVNFISPWRPLQYDVEREGIPRQLASELSEGHPLWGKGCEVIGRTDTNDDVLAQCADGTFAIIHLTWSRGPGSAEYPQAIVYKTVEDLNDALWRDAVSQGFVDDLDPEDPRLKVGE